MYISPSRLPSRSIPPAWCGKNAIRGDRLIVLEASAAIDWRLRKSAEPSPVHLRAALHAASKSDLLPGPIVTGTTSPM